MNIKKYDEVMKKRNLLMPDSLWNELSKAAQKLAKETGQVISTSDLIRIGAEDLLKKLQAD
jgi:hypothetical protein